MIGPVEEGRTVAGRERAAKGQGPALVALGSVKEIFILGHSCSNRMHQKAYHVPHLQTHLAVPKGGQLESVMQGAPPEHSRTPVCWELPWNRGFRR